MTTAITATAERPAPAPTLSSDWRQRAARRFPGGVNSPVRAYRAVDGDPPILVRGKGATVWDADGREYVDYVGAYGPLILGHANPRVTAAIRQAARDGGPFGATHPAEIRLAERITASMPSIERLRFVSSGTEAVMSALRVARAATGRDLIVKFDGGYHGHADSLLVSAGSGLATLGMPASAGVPAAVAAGTLVARNNSLDSVSRLLAAHPDTIAAVIVEPVSANMGVVAPKPGFLEGLRRLTTAAGALLIFDEVISGFRVGRGGAQGIFGVVPDLTTLGKIIGGGLPIGAYGGRTELLDLVAPVGPVYQAGTLAGHPLAMVAGEAALAQLDDALYVRLDRNARRLETGLAEAASAAGVPASVGRVGSLLTLFFRSGPPPTDADQVREADPARFAAFHRGYGRPGVPVTPVRPGSLVPVGRPLEGSHRSNRRRGRDRVLKSAERRKRPMAYVIAEPCIDVLDISCVSVCPVDCIHYEEGTDRKLFIDPNECIDCGACEPECPVNAIFPEESLPTEWANYTKIDAVWFTDKATARAIVDEAKPQ